MTRINCVDVTILSDRHLVAEYYELPRAMTLANKAWHRHELADDPRNPKKYVLGKGHIRFFYNKQKWLRMRHTKLVTEMLFRGMKPQLDHTRTNKNMPKSWQGDWVPDGNDIKLNMDRLIERDPEHYK